MKFPLRSRIYTELTIDDEDYERMRYITWRKKTNNGKICIYSIIENQTVMLSQFLMYGEQGIFYNHKNNDPLDFRKCNLEVRMTYHVTPKAKHDLDLRTRRMLSSKTYYYADRFYDESRAYNKLTDDDLSMDRLGLRSEFRDRIADCPKFRKALLHYIDNGLQLGDKPMIRRINRSTGYFFDNIKIVTPNTHSDLEEFDREQAEKNKEQNKELTM